MLAPDQSPNKQVLSAISLAASVLNSQAHDQHQLPPVVIITGSLENLLKIVL
jgi:hypothetical protein